MANLARDQRSVRKQKVPSWDLALVLQALTEGPFEPMDEAELRWLTLKSILLVALASGRRRGVLHALWADLLGRDEHWAFVILKTDPAFLSKTDLASRRSVFQSVRVPALSTFIDGRMEEDVKWCPVRALKMYLQRSESLRAHSQKLFVSYKKGHQGDIHKNTISSWIKKPVLAAYKWSSADARVLHRVRAHDVRGLAASLAVIRNVATRDILEAGGWGCHNTFTSFTSKT